MADRTSQEDSATRVVGSIDDISKGSPLVVAVADTRIAIFYEDGEYFALNNVCPHQGGPLGDGKIEDDCVYCPWHGWKFDLETGEHVHGVDAAETYPVTVDDGKIRVEL